jgi:dGTPase
MEYSSLLRIDRLRKSTRKEKASLRTEVASDFGRIITSPAFRRLQAKAQVFSLEENDGVRTRLTHSQEVAGVGRQIAAKIIDYAPELIPVNLQNPFISTVENACLLHDIGNPPFGHFGEYAIASWFRDKQKEYLKVWNSPETIGYYSDFLQFDGNPQGYRMITRLAWHNDEYGLNLTCSLLSAYLKYLSHQKDEEKGKFFKKMGYFKVDEGTVASVRKCLQIESDSYRNPLTFLMEASDDTSYCVSDIEDGIEKGIIRWHDVVSFVESVLTGVSLTKWNALVEETNSKVTHEKSKFVELKIKIVSECTDFIAKEYIANHTDIIEGRCQRALYDQNSTESQILEALKKFAKTKLFTSKQACDLELCAYSVIRGLLDHFQPLLFLELEEFNRLVNGHDSKLHLEKRLVALLPSKHVLAYNYEVNLRPELEPILRAHLIVDYISGMTDNHALHVFQLLSGISTKVRA